MKFGFIEEYISNKETTKEQRNVFIEDISMYENETIIEKFEFENDNEIHVYMNNRILYY
jgi:hypothetical protein